MRCLIKWLSTFQIIVLEWLVMMTSSAGRGGESDGGEGQEGQTPGAGGPKLYLQEALVSLLSLLHPCHYQSQEPHAHSHQREAICLPWVSISIYYKRPSHQAHVYTHRREAICLPLLSISNCSERNFEESYIISPQDRSRSFTIYQLGFMCDVFNFSLWFFFFYCYFIWGLIMLKVIVLTWEEACSL